MKFYIESYGCTANNSDANLVKGLLFNHPKHCLTSTLNQADVIVILTCTVIATTEQRMLHRIRQFMVLNKKIVIAGCMASVQQDLIRSLFPTAFLLPPRKIHQLFEVLCETKTDEKLNEKAQVSKRHDGPIAPISIAEGCLFSCSYCITHVARGTLFSYEPQTVISSVKQALQQGCKEIQLTAQDTASYGLDIHSSLPQLLGLICDLPGDFMIRIGMMNPRTVKNIFSKLLPFYSKNCIYSFFHLPIQSGDNTILDLMKRGYHVNDVITIVKQARRIHPNLTIATDAIVGFPTETEEQFQKTIQLLETIQPDVINITRFSARPFTKAKTMNGRIPTEIVKKRSRLLTSICSKLTKKRNKRYIGETMHVLPLKKGKMDTIIARSSNYKPVIIQDQIPLGEKRTVDIIDATETYLVGTLK
jgi:threonylcarbamoyladenosine tRNA methylthiotransferase CDKAL1